MKKRKVIILIVFLAIFSCNTEKKKNYHREKTKISNDDTNKFNLKIYRGYGYGLDTTVQVEIRQLVYNYIDNQKNGPKKDCEKILLFESNTSIRPLNIYIKINNIDTTVVLQKNKYEIVFDNFELTDKKPFLYDASMYFCD